MRLAKLKHLGKKLEILQADFSIQSKKKLLPLSL